MSFGGDDRAVTVVVGAVLLLGIFVTAIAVYQVNVVPEQNYQTEIDHHERLAGDLIDLRDGVVNADRGTAGTGVPITLGTQYEQRLAGINPPQPHGTIRTADPGGPVEIEADGVSRTFESSVLTYEHDYNEYRDAPDRVLEHTLLYDQYGSENVTREQPTLVQGDSLVLPLVDGDLSETASGTASVTVDRVEGPRTASSGGNVSVTLPTEAPDRWAEYADSRSDATVESSTTASVTLDLDVAEVTLYRVSVGDDPGPDQLDGFGDETDPGSGASEYLIGFDGPATEAVNEGDGVHTSCESDGSACSFVLDETSDTLDLVATTSGAVVGAAVDYAVGTGSVVERFDRDGETGTDGTDRTTVEVDVDRGQQASFPAYVSSGGDAARMDVTIDRAARDVPHVGTPTTFGENDAGVAFEITNEGTSAITVDGISLDDTDADAVRVNDDGGPEVEIEVDGSLEGSLDTGVLTSIDIDGSEYELDESATIDPGESATVSIDVFRESTLYSTVDMRGHELDLTLYFEDGSQPFFLDVGPDFTELSAATTKDRGGGTEATAIEVEYVLTSDADGVDLTAVDDDGTTVTDSGDGTAGVEHDVELEGLGDTGEPSNNYPIEVTVAADPGYCYVATVEDGDDEPTLQADEWEDCV